MGAVEAASTRQAPAQVPAELRFANGLGGFSANGREYVIHLAPGQTTPAPWSNVLANPYFGSVISESGGAYTWCENAHEYRLTPWYNDPLSDASGEAFYIRDETTGEIWSPTPLPARAPATYETRHGFGYSTFAVSHGGIASELTLLVASDAPVKIAVLKLRNDGDTSRSLSLTGYCEWVFGELRPKTLLHVTSEVDAVTGALFARNSYHPDFGGRIGFLAVSAPVTNFTADRSEFIGRNGSLARPDGLRRSQLASKVGAGLDACAALQTLCELEPGEEREIVFLLGVGRDVDDARTLIRRFCGPVFAGKALVEVASYWQQTLDAVQIKTPDDALNILANGWLLYQIVASRLWARSGYYQSGGAYGFRDQLQDTMALVHSQPTYLRQQILRCAAHQFRDGDVQHWWHPPNGRGVRTHFSDDYLWLPFATCRYVLSTADTGVLDVRVSFVEGRSVKPDEEAYMDLPTISEDAASLYDHCVRAIRRGMRYGVHGLPLMGCGDWNDGMNMVGAHGKGESVWLAFFFYDVLQQFAEVAELHNDKDFARVCREEAAALQGRIEANAWDGDWYRRAYFDGGEPMGSAANSECQIDALPQSWSVLSGAGEKDRALVSMQAVDKRLIDRRSSLVKLFDPPFDRSEPNPGYIKGYVPGVRENGGQYTHAAIWTAMAFAELGQSRLAWEIVRMINPIGHTLTPAAVATYCVEPYVMAADVYAVPSQIGRGGWTWYTGSAGWMYRLILESLLGLKLVVNKLYFTPCLPPDWQEFSLRYRFRQTYYAIHVYSEHDTKVGAKVRVTVDGEPSLGEALIMIDDQREHKVEIYVPYRPDTSRQGGAPPDPATATPMPPPSAQIAPPESMSLH